MKSASMFRSWFNIKLTNKKIEKIFQDDMLLKGNKYTNYLTIINAIFLSDNLYCCFYYLF